MRVSWQVSVGILLACIWPQLGCLHPQADKAIQEDRPESKAAAAKKEPPPPAQAALSPADQAAALERAGKFREAIAVYEKMRVQGSPDALLATKLLAALYLRNNDLERAEQEYRELLKQNPQDAAVLTFLGDISSRRGLWETAGNMYSEALRYQPGNVSARSGLAMELAHEGLKHEGYYARSVEEFKKVPMSEADAQCEVAWVMRQQGKQAEAFKAYQAALSVEPNHARARAELAALRQKGFIDAPASFVRVTTPLHTTGIAELQPAPGVTAEGMSRLQTQWPTLPPSDFVTGSESPKD